MEIDADPGQAAQLARGRHLQDAAARHVADVQEAIVRQRQADRAPHQRLFGVQRRARHGAHHPFARHLADRAVLAVGDQDAASRVHHQRGRGVEARGMGRPIEVAGNAVASHRGDKAVGRDAPDAVVVGVGHEHVAGPVDRHADRPVEQRLASNAVAVAWLAIAGKCGDHARRRDLADRVIAGVGHIQVAAGVDRDRRRRME